jgi:PD-(D/E)XK endonuclease
MRTTQRKGDIAKSRAIATFTEKGYDVALLVTESAAYDLIVDMQGALHRVQVKFSATKQVDLRRIHSNSKGYVVKKYSANDYDWLYVLTADGEEHVVTESLAGRSTINLRPEHKIGR